MHFVANLVVAQRMNSSGIRCQFQILCAKIGCLKSDAEPFLGLITYRFGLLLRYDHRCLGHRNKYAAQGTSIIHRWGVSERKGY